MEPQQYQQLADTEDRHWWHRSRQRLVAHHLDRLDLGQRARILDVGCGTGGTTRFLLGYGSVVGLDRSEHSLAHARKKAPQAMLVQGDANQLGQLFAPGSFDLITFFNVLYHRWMEDDQSILSDAARLLAPGGHLLLTEPAFQILWREHDRLDMGKRRYRMRDFTLFFDTAGLESVTGQYFNALAVPACLTLAALDPLKPLRRDTSAQSGEMAVPGEGINKALYWYMGLETSLLRMFRLPIGVTLLTIARRPS